MPQEKPAPFIEPKAPEKKSAEREPLGPLVGAGIVVILLIIGALYFWGAELNKQPQQDNLPFITGEPVLPSE